MCFWIECVYRYSVEMMHSMDLLSIGSGVTRKKGVSLLPCCVNMSPLSKTIYSTSDMYKDLAKREFVYSYLCGSKLYYYVNMGLVVE